MKIFCTLLWAAILAITVKRCRAEFLLVEVNHAAEKSKLLSSNMNTDSKNKSKKPNFFKYC